MKFNKGDVIIYIDNSKLNINAKLTLYKECEEIPICGSKTLQILDDEGENFGIFPHRFISLKEFRKNKINKINKTYEK